MNSMFLMINDSGIEVHCSRCLVTIAEVISLKLIYCRCSLDSRIFIRIMICVMHYIENKKLFCESRNHCKRVLKEARSNYADTTRRSVASQLIGSCDFWRICNSILNSVKYTIPPLFNGPDVLKTYTDKANLFARNFSPLMMVPNIFPIFHLVLNRDLALRISQP